MLKKIPVLNAKKRWMIKLTFIIGFMSFLLLFGAIFIRFLLNMNVIENDILDYTNALHIRNTDRTDKPIQIFDRNNKLMGRFYNERTHKMNYAQCKTARSLRDVATISEDNEFYNHFGISIYSILRAIFRNVITFSLEQGAGTITQQLARNLFTKWQQEFKITRKIYETYVAIYLERLIQKDEILCLYLNNIYMGEGRIGAYEAAKFYFNKQPHRLNIAESAMIIGILPAPSAYSPLNNIESALKKQDLVLRLLVRAGYITKNQKKQQLKQFFSQYNIDTTLEYNAHGDIGKLGTNWYFDYNQAPDVNQFIRLHLLNNYSKEILNKGLYVYTSVDLKKQQDMAKTMRATINTARTSLLNNLHSTTRNKESILNGLNGVFISMHSKTGDVLSMVTGYTHSEEGYINRAYQMYRQPGSTIKPFLYALSLEHEIFKEPPYTVIDQPVNFNGYKPRNWYSNYKGEISLEEAIALSTNTVAVKVLDELGISKFTSTLEDILSFNPERKKRKIKHNLTLALGSSEVSPIELATIYSVLENGGYTISPTIIKSIEDENANILYESNYLEYQEKIFEKETIAKILLLLKAVMEHEKGTANHIYKKLQAANLNFSISAKTGSVSAYKGVLEKLNIQLNDKKSLVHDAWFAAIIPNEVNIIWVGHDIGIPFKGSGGGLGGRTWLQYALRALKNKKETEFSALLDYQKEVMKSLQNDVEPSIQLEY